MRCCDLASRWRLVILAWTTPISRLDDTSCDWIDLMICGSDPSDMVRYGTRYMLVGKYNVIRTLLLHNEPRIACRVWCVAR